MPRFPHTRGREPVVGRYRRSFAAYFYSAEPPPDFTNQDTVWHPRAPKIR